MSSNLIKLIGFTVSAIVIYLCIITKKDEIFTKLHAVDAVIPQAISQKNTIEPMNDNNSVVSENQKSDAAFGILMGEKIKIVGMFAPSEKTGILISFIDKLCEKKQCENDIRYSEDIKKTKWQKNIVSLIQFLDEENVPDGSVFINSNTLKIEGKFTGSAQKNRIQKIKEALHKNGLTIIDQKVESVLSARTSQTEAVENNNSSKKLYIRQKDNKSTINQEISDLLEKAEITYDNTANRITIESQKRLNKVINLIKKSTYHEVSIDVYMNLGENNIYNKVVSQKKADIIQRYFTKNEIKNTKAKGHDSLDKSRKNHIEIIIK